MSRKPCLRAAIYARIARNNPCEKSLLSQIERCRTYCIQSRYVLNETHMFAEMARGDTLAGRPALHTLLLVAQAGEIDLVVVTLRGRLAWQTDVLQVITAQLQATGVEIDALSVPEHVKNFKSVCTRRRLS